MLLVDLYFGLVDEERPETEGCVIILEWGLPPRNI